MQEKIKKISLNIHSTIFLSNKYKVYSVGNNKKGELGIGQYINLEECKNSNKIIEIVFFKNKKIINIFSGSFYSFAISKNNEIYGWGKHSMGMDGQLGSNDYKKHYTPIKIFKF